ncbi:hypothetical protein Syun_030434 [Stephania yunnanensis]|uniref:Cytochrome P450 n=1 Tax=Stephania yunnanensis TaxID=152371 RepID=A0AAP0E9S7_9MAGN
MEMVLLLISLFLLFFFSLFFLFKNSSNNANNLPPGPPPFPIIGNLFQLGSKPHSTLAQLSQTYGPLFSLKFGSQLVVVASSPGAASEVLKTHDNVLSGRYIIYNARSKNYVEHSMVWAPECTEEWKNLRKICRKKLFSSRAIEGHARILREGKVEEMMVLLREKEGELVKVSEVVFGTIFNVLGCLIFSKDVFDHVRGDEEVRDVKGHLCRMLELGSAISLADCFPILGWMTWGRKVSEECRRNVFASWRDIIKERRESLSRSSSGAMVGHGSSSTDDDKEDFLTSLIKAGFNNDQINALLLEIFGAAADTTTSTIEWAMVEILKNPRVLHKVRSELAERLNPKSENKTNNVHKMALKEADLPHLPYLQAITKETLRLHPATPLLLPRRALQTCKVMGYTIPKDCQILVNAWAIGRDSKTWEDALAFLPERFLESQVDYRGNGNFELVPFGGGRRICPGVPLASQLIPLIVGSMIWNFDWRLPHGMSLHELSRDEKFGLTLQKDPPLVLVHGTLKID